MTPRFDIDLAGTATLAVVSAGVAADAATLQLWPLAGVAAVNCATNVYLHVTFRNLKGATR